MLITLAIFLCPTSYGSASSHYYSGIVSVEDIPKYDWCSFVLDWLVTSIQKFEESAAKGNAIGKDRTSSLGGCLFVLAVTYFEYIRTSDILLRDDIPRLKIWDDYMIQEFLTLNGNSGDGRDFGLLEEDAKPLRECMCYYMLTHPLNEKYDTLADTKRILDMHGITVGPYH